MSKGTLPVQQTSEHKVYQARKDQLKRNQLAFHGGRAYIDARLWRGTNESNLSWDGRHKSTDSLEGRVGRRQRTCLVNDASRIANKITQYLFKTPVRRIGIDDEFRRNVTGDGKTVTEFWMDVNERFTTSQWVWLQVDSTAPSKGMRQITEHERKANNYRVVWKAWDALSVRNWHFGKDGKLKWIIVESEIYDNSDPSVEAKHFMMRTLFHKKEDGKVYLSEYSNDAPASVEMMKDEILEINEIPFVLVGAPSEEGWWFDDVEAIQATTLNLGSQHHDILTKAVYPQYVLPASMANSPEANLVETDNGTGMRKFSELKLQIVKSMEVPVFENPDDKGITRPVQPNAADMEPLPNEIDRLRGHLFDMSGLALFNKESRQAQTAESKQFDMLDTESTLMNRALLMQEAEEKMVALSVEFYKSFKKYSPEWPQSFDVTDYEDISKVIITVGNMAYVTPKVRKMLAEAGVKLLTDACKYDDEKASEAIDEIWNSVEPTA